MNDSSHALSYLPAASSELGVVTSIPLPASSRALTQHTSGNTSHQKYQKPDRERRHNFLPVAKWYERPSAPGFCPSARPRGDLSWADPCDGGIVHG